MGKAPLIGSQQSGQKHTGQQDTNVANEVIGNASAADKGRVSDTILVAKHLLECKIPSVCLASMSKSTEKRNGCAAAKPDRRAQDIRPGVNFIAD
jgi:hypothetical protein